MSFVELDMMFVEALSLVRMPLRRHHANIPARNAHTDA